MLNNNCLFSANEPSRRLSKYKLQQKCKSLINYCISKRVFNNKTKFFYNKEAIVKDKQFYNGYWLLEFNNVKRVFLNIKSVYLFLKDIVKLL